MKALRTAAFVVGAAALIATGVGAAVGAGLLAAGTIGASAATLTAIGAGLSAAAGVLSIAAMAAAPKGTLGGNATKFKIDKEAGIPVVIGRSYTGGNVVHRQYYNRPGSKAKNQAESWVTILSLGLVHSVGPLLIDKVPVTFNSSGAAVGTFSGNMWLATQKGACPEPTALAGPFGAFPGWNGASKLSGLAADIWTLDFDTKGEKFPNGVPDRGRVVEGVLVYDPRKDSTYPGGMGTCRLGQPDTYVYSTNPGPHAITWAYGHYQNGVLMAGGGLPASGLDLAPFVEWSNVCDANGWTVGGVVYSTTDNAWDVLKMICQAGSAEPLPVGAQLSVAFSAPRVSIGTIRSNDVTGDLDVPATVSRRLRRNTIIPSVRLESHGWEMVPLDPVVVPDYVAIDGGSRPKEVVYPLIQNAKQGAQIALYEMLNARELDGIVVPAKVYALGYRPGDCITLQVPEANMIGREVDGGTMGATLTCRTETKAKHDFALGKTTTPPPTPDLSSPGIDRSAPDAGDWSAVGGTLQANGVATPAIIVTSNVDQLAADEVVFDYRPYINGAAPDVGWTGASIEPSSVLRKEITSVTTDTAYDVGVRYRIRGAVSDRLIISNVVVGTVTLPWDNVSGGTKPQDNATVGAPPGTIVGDRPAEEVIAEIEAAKKRREEIDAELIKIDGAVADASTRIQAAKDRADAAFANADTVNSRVDQLIAEGGGGSEGVDTVARSEIARVEQAAISRDDAIGQRIDTVQTSFGTAIDAKAQEVTTAYTAADVALASRTAVVEANMRAAPQFLNQQATFSDWPENRGEIPNGWGLALQTGGGVVRRQGIVGRYAMEVAWPGGAGNLYHAVSGFYHGDEGYGVDPGMFTGPGWFVIEVDVTLVDGTFLGAGVYLAGYDSNGNPLYSNGVEFFSMPDSTGAIPELGVPGRRYRFSVMMQIEQQISALRFHPMTAWQGFRPEPQPKTLRWHMAGVRRASAEEISNRKARLTDLPAAVARIKTTEDTLSDLPNRFAAAQRVDTLEAQVNFAADSGLQRTINARIEDRSAAIADAKAGAVAQTVSQLRTEYDQARGELTVTTSVASDAYGRSRAFLQQKAVAGNNRAQLTLYADSNAGAGVDIIGDVSISGDLVVDGTIFTRKIANNAVSAFFKVAGSSGNVPTSGGSVNLAALTVPISSASSTVRLSIAGVARLPGLPAGNYMEVRILDNTGIVLDWTKVSNVLGNNQSFSFFQLLDGVSGTPTYTIQARAKSPKPNNDYDNPEIALVMVVEEFKK